MGNVRIQQIAGGQHRLVVSGGAQADCIVIHGHGVAVDSEGNFLGQPVSDQILLGLFVPDLSGFAPVDNMVAAVGFDDSGITGNPGFVKAPGIQRLGQLTL
jgi:hypothetical protein